MARSGPGPVTVIIPAFDEEASIGEVVSSVGGVLRRLDAPHEIIVVDDGSRDATRTRAGDAGARVIVHDRNRGYGAALKTGVVAARAETLLIVDADGTYPVDRIPAILAMLQSADLVIGVRVGSNVKIPLVRRPAKWLLRRLAEYVAGAHIPDLNSGLRAFRRSTILTYLPILPDGFSFTTTQTLGMLCDNYRVSAVPIDYHRRTGRSKVVPFDFFNLVSIILRISMQFNPLKLFVPVALMCMGLGFGKLALDLLFAVRRAGGPTLSILTTPTISPTTLILMLGGLQILLIGMMSDGLARRIGHQRGAGIAPAQVEGLDPGVERQEREHREG